MVDNNRIDCRRKERMIRKDDLENEKADLEIEYHIIGGKIQAIEKELLAIKWAKIPIGKMVNYREKEYQITGYTEYWPMGRLIKKDGSLGQNEQALYGREWEK